MSKLKSILFQLKATGKSFSQLINRKLTSLIELLNNYAILISAVATLIIAIYAISTFTVQKKLSQLQESIVAMQTEPKLIGSVSSWIGRSESKYEYYYKLTNIGSDTAWSVFPRGQALILCDTMLIYPETYLFGLMYAGGGTFYGDFSRGYPIPPAKSKEWGFSGIVREDFFSIIKYVEWDNFTCGRYNILE